MQNLKQERHGTEARRRARARASSLFLSTALVLAWAGGQAQAQSLSESAGGEIRDVLTAKELLTPAPGKMSSDLVEQLPSPQAEALRNAAGRSAPPPSRDVLVDITADVSPALQDRIRSSGGVIIESVPEYNSVRARVPADKLEEIASSPEVRSVRSADIAETRKATITEGVQAHAVDDARARFGADGTGVSVGVLSDAVDSLQALQAEQELPQVDVLPGQAGSGGSEGTAMLEIVNGMAPGSELHF